MYCSAYTNIENKHYVSTDYILIYISYVWDNFHPQKNEKFRG